MQEQRRFSRQNEQEADRIGLVNLEKAGFDPRAMPSMFERLNQALSAAHSCAQNLTVIIAGCAYQWM